jgi:hypothetical protein
LLSAIVAFLLVWSCSVSLVCACHLSCCCQIFWWLSLHHNY